VQNNENSPTVQFGYYEALGIMTALSMQVDLYRKWFVHDLDAFFVPALYCKQFKIYLNDNGSPNAFVTWAFLNDADHSQMLVTGNGPDLFESGNSPNFNKWTDGAHLWFMDTIAPFGNTLSIIRDLQRNHFKNVQIAHSIKRSIDGSVVKVKTWKNFGVGSEKR
jgi:cytolysin-activating lysine-acyltransferase